MRKQKGVIIDMHPYLHDERLVGFFNKNDFFLNLAVPDPRFKKNPLELPPPKIVPVLGPKKMVREETVAKLAPVAPVQLELPLPTIISLPSLRERLTYANLAVWLIQQTPVDIIGRRRNHWESVSQRFLDEHGGRRLPMALEPWDYIFEMLLNEQDPVNPLITVKQALKAINDPMVQRAIGMRSIFELDVA